MRAAWFLSLEADRRSAHFASLVLPALVRDGFEIELFSDAEPQRISRELDGVPRSHFLLAEKRHRLRPFDFMIHSLEDHPSAAFVRLTVGLFPGLVIFHDLELRRLNTDGLHFVQLEEDSAREFELSHAAAALTMNIHALHRARTAGVLAELTAHPVRPLGRKTAAREALGVPVDTPLVGLSGVELWDDRVLVALEALRLLGAERSARCCWFAVGEEAEKRSAAVLHRHGSGALPTRVVPLASLDDLQQGISACDVVIAMRRSLWHDLPLALSFAFAEGVPAVAADFGPSEELPPAVVMKVPLGRGEAWVLASAVQTVLDDARLRQQLVSGARAFAAEVLSPAAVAEDLRSTVQRHAAVLGERLGRREEEYRSRQQAMLDEVRQSTGLTDL